MEISTTFPCKNLFSQLLPKLSHCVQGPPSCDRFSRLPLKVRHLTRAQQPSCLKPPQERTEIREQLHRLPVLNRPSIQEIQCHMVADPAEPVSPVGITQSPALSDIST